MIFWRAAQTRRPRDEISFQIVLHLRAQFLIGAEPGEIPGIIALRDEQAALERVEGAAQFFVDRAHLGEGGLIADRVSRDVAEGEQNFQPPDIAHRVGLLHFVPKTGDVRAPIGPQVGMQSPNEKTIEFLDSRVDRRFRFFFHLEDGSGTGPPLLVRRAARPVCSRTCAT